MKLTVFGLLFSTSWFDVESLLWYTKIVNFISKSMDCTSIINVIGLVCDLIGGVILFSSVKRSQNVGSQTLDDGSEMPFQLTNENTKLSKLGFGFFILGAILQIVSLVITTTV